MSLCYGLHPLTEGRDNPHLWIVCTMKKPGQSQGLTAHPLAPGENRTVARPWPSSRWKSDFSPRGLWSVPVQPSFSPQVNKWLITVAVMLAAAIEVLDMTIANVALDHIRGSFSAGVDEAAWVLTSYIVANATTVALTGWLSTYFGRKRFFIFCISLFTLSSFLCGAAPNLPSLVLFRILQGAAGGAMMPLSQAILMETFPPEERAKAMAVWGIGMLLAPIVGPILGGWITDNYSWRWIFYINLPMGFLAFFLVMWALHEPADQPTVQRVDWWGMGFLIAGIASLQLMLDKGEREDWFSSDFICILTAGAVVGLVSFVVRELRTAEPIVDLRLLKNRTFAVGTLCTTIIMFGMFGTFILVPLYCQLVAGYTPFLAGEVMTIQSIGTFVSIVVAGRLFNRIDPRLIVACGCVVAGIGAWQMAHFNPQAGFWEIAWPGLFRGIGSGFIFVPMTTLSLATLAAEQMRNATALFNMLRTIGGSIGIAVLMSFLSQGTQMHQNHLIAHIHPYNPVLWQQLTLAGSLPGLGGDGMQGGASLALIYGEVQRQALLLSFVDDFRLIAYLFFILTPVVFLMRRPQLTGSVAAH